MNRKRPGRHVVVATTMTAAILLAILTVAQERQQAQTTPTRQKSSEEKRYRGRLGPDNPKIKTKNSKTLLWAGGGPPESPQAKWYDFTGAPIPPEDLQFGIGKDRIRAIDDPLFVEPDDPRLLQIPPSRYRPNQRPKTNDEIMVMGYADGGDVRAYPVALLDGHELVNDRVGGKPVTVGW